MMDEAPKREPQPPRKFPTLQELRARPGRQAIPAALDPLVQRLILDTKIMPPRKGLLKKR